MAGEAVDAKANAEWQQGPSLTIVIPALNEEDAIGGTIERCLAARESIKHTAGLGEITIVVVSDGSTDRTPQIAADYADVDLIVFEQNRGYGAAIKEGWGQFPSDYLAFLDADGTCDPDAFSELCRVAIDESADVVLGSRMGAGSKMPAIRRFGNRVFAILLGSLCGRRITDTASGMRVICRKALRHLYPLPDGLHFTPSMSARALLNDLRVIEVPMAYEERIGASKLHAFRDGVRFLKTIFTGVLSYQPERILRWPLLFCLLGIGLLGAYPVEFYLRNSMLEEWMIYRFVACQLLGSVALSLLLSIALLQRVAFFGPRRTTANRFWASIVAEVFSGWRLAAVGVGLAIAAVGFLWPGIVQYTTITRVSMHWSRLIAGAFSLFGAAQCVVFGLLFTVVDQWIDQTSERLRAQHETPVGRRE